MKKWIYLILAVLLICGGVFGYIWWMNERAAAEAAAEADRRSNALTAEMRENRKILEKMNQAEERLKKDSPELYKLSTQPAKDK